jgi:hypothetical protein
VSCKIFNILMLFLQYLFYKLNGTYTPDKIKVKEEVFLFLSTALRRRTGDVETSDHFTHSQFLHVEAK